MQKLNRYIILALVFAMSLGSAFSGSKDKVFADLKQKLDGLETVHVVFGVNNSDMVGEIYAKKGGKMRMSLRDNIIISDGSTIWNVSPGNSVAISEYEENDGFSLETILFELVSNLKPVKYSKLSKTDSNVRYSLELKPEANSKYDKQLESMEIQYNNSKEMNNIIVNQSNGSTVSYQIRKITYNPELSSNKFTYQPTEGIEVIDFR